MTDAALPAGAVEREAREADHPPAADGRVVLERARTAAAPWVTAATGFGVGETAGTIAFAAGLAWVIAAIGAGAPSATLALAAGVATAGAVARAAGAYGQARCGFEAGAAAKRTLRRIAASAVARAGPAFTQRHEAGALAIGLSDQIDAFDGYAARYLPASRLAAAAPLLLAAAAFTQSWVVGAILLATAPFAPLAMAVAGVGAAKAAQAQMVELERLSGRFFDRLRALPTLRAFNAEARELSGLTAAAADFRVRTMRVLRRAFASSAALELTAGVAVALTAIYATLSMLGVSPVGDWGRLSVAQTVFVVLIAAEFMTPLRRLAGAYHERRSADAAADALARLLPRAAETPERPAAQTVFTTPPAVRFDDVRAVYPDGRVGLDTTSFLAPGGRMTALLSPSGGGKSTVLKLIMGFAAPTAGRICLEDAYQSTPWDAAGGFAAHAAWLAQRPRLFHGSVEDNVRLSAPEAPAGAVWAALDAAGVTAFVDALPDGLATIIGERGHGLSGGEAQRVALARALLSEKPIILLDEPTAALDADTAAAFLEALRQAAAHRTVIIATHDAACAAAADHVVRLA